MTCRDHGLEPCAVPRCQVLALCAAEIRQAIAHGALVWASYGMTLGYPIEAIVEAVATRLVAWMRWRGDVACMACGGTGKIRRDRCPLCRGTGARPGWHRLDVRATHEQRIRALSSTCPRADCWARPSDGHREHAFGLPCDHDGIDWATVLVLLDWLTDHGWTLQEVHEWRPRAIAADPMDQLAGALAMPATALSGAYRDAAAIDQEWHRIAVLMGGPASLLDAVRAGIQEYALRSPHPLLEVYRFAAEHIAARGELAAMWWASQREVVARPDVRGV